VSSHLSPGLPNTYLSLRSVDQRQSTVTTTLSRLQLKCDGTRWRTGGEVKGNWRMEWVASTLHTTSEHGVSSITTADAHTSAASSRLKWRPCRFKWSRPFRRKTKSGFCACAITFLTQTNRSRTYSICYEWPRHYCCRLMRTALTLLWWRRVSQTHGHDHQQMHSS
jgi:hypothetical protein